MRFRLAESLEYIAEQSKGTLEFDTTALSRLVAQLRGRDRFPASVFALYYDVTDAILDGRLEEAKPLMAELCAQAPLSERLSVTMLDPEVMGAGSVERYSRMVDTDALSRFMFGPPPPDAAERFFEVFQGSMGLMIQAAPTLAEEFQALVSEIVLASGESADGKSSFDGASSFLLWGALFVNPIDKNNPVSLIETLAHESAHSLLFGLAIDDPLVLNPDSERFQSPLRIDPRPMDGIYHAAFVLARMHYAMSMLLASGLLDAASVEEAQVRREASRRAFLDGDRTIKQHGRLTTRGEAILAGARGYFDALA